METRISTRAEINGVAETSRLVRYSGVRFVSPAENRDYATRTGNGNFLNHLITIWYAAVSSALRGI